MQAIEISYGFPLFALYYRMSVLGEKLLPRIELVGTPPLVNSCCEHASPCLH